MLNFAAELSLLINSILCMKMSRKKLSLLLFCLSMFLPGPAVKAQLPGDSAVNWQSLAQVKELMKTKARPIILVFYKEGHDSSAMMLNNTLKYKEICTYINHRFYAIKMNACSDSVIAFFDNRTYTKQAGKSYNDLTVKMLGETPALPSLLFFNKETAGFTFKGYRDRYDMLSILVYFAEEVEKTTPYDFWASAYLKAFPPKVSAKVPEMPVHWYSLREALDMNNREPKGIFVYWSTSWSASSSVMMANAFAHPKLAEYMNANFYCVKLDAQISDTLTWKTAYINENKPGHFHQLALAQLQGKMKFPALLFFDKQNNMVSSNQYYLGAVNMYALANFVGTESYKTMKLQDFVKTFKVDWE